MYCLPFECCLCGILRGGKKNPCAAAARAVLLVPSKLSTLSTLRDPHIGPTQLSPTHPIFTPSLQHRNLSLGTLLNMHLTGTALDPSSELDSAAPSSGAIPPSELDDPAV